MPGAERALLSTTRTLCLARRSENHLCFDASGGLAEASPDAARRNGAAQQDPNLNTNAEVRTTKREHGSPSGIHEHAHLAGLDVNLLADDHPHLFVLLAPEFHLDDTVLRIFEFHLDQRTDRPHVGDRRP